MKTEINTRNLAYSYLNQIAKKYEPNVKIVEKHNSLLMKIISLLVFLFNRKFMTDYVTVIGSTIYVPKGYLKNSNRIQVLSVIMHETIHLKQKKDNKILFYLKYLFPQSLILLTMPVIIGTILVFKLSFWFLLIGLLPILPLPAYWRFKFEVEAYRDANLLIFRYVYGIDLKKEHSKKIINYIVNELTGPFYYFTMPFKKKVLEELLKYNNFEKDNLNDSHKEILNFLKSNNISMKKKF